ncbi:MAG: tetratricopeptide repeat protein [bacterium]
MQRNLSSVIFMVALISVFFCFFPACKGEKDTKPSASTGFDLKSSIKKQEDKLKQEPDNEQARQNLIELLFQMGAKHERAGRHASAAATYQRILKLDPDKIHAHYLLGKALMEEGKYQQALNSFDKVISADPKYTADLYELTGECHLELGNKEQAKKALLKSVVINPVSKNVYTKLARLYRAEGKKEKAKEKERVAAELEKWGYPNRGFKEKSLQEWKKTAKSIPEPYEKKEAGPSAKKKKALALYNIATYHDRAIERENPLSYQKAMKNWKSYVYYSKDIEEEAKYRATIKEHVGKLKDKMKELYKKYELMGVHDLVGVSGKLGSKLLYFGTMFEKLDKKKDTFDKDSLERYQKIKSKYEAIDVKSYASRFDEISRKANSLIKRRIAGKIDDKELARKSRRLSNEVEKLKSELVDAGIVEIEKVITKLGGEYGVPMPKHPPQE